MLPIAMQKHFPARRKFIKQLALGISALAIPQLNVARSVKNRLGIALVGLGNYSTNLLAPALQCTKYCHLVGIVTGTPAKAERWQRRYGIANKNIYDYTTFDQIANNPDIDVVYVVLPNSMHAEYVIRAANAGKHVWCEKPMTLTVKECVTMIKACQNNTVSLAIGYRMQHESNTQKLIRFGTQRTYGQVKSIAAAAGSYHNHIDQWRHKRAMGGGAVYDMGVYALQAARYCSGEEPLTVTAQHVTQHPEIYQNVDETTLFDLEFASGISAHCTTSFSLKMNTLRVNCDNGWYQLEPFQAYNGVQGMTSDGQKFVASLDNQQAKQMDDDALAILQGQPLLVPGEEGLRDIRVVEAIFESARTKQRVVI